MEFLDFLVLGAKAGSDLPTLGDLKSWAKQVVEQAIYIVTIFVVCKFLIKMSIGKIVGIIALASALVLPFETGLWLLDGVEHYLNSYKR